MPYCDICAHKEVCGSEDVVSEAMKYCADRLIICYDSIDRQEALKPYAELNNDDVISVYTIKKNLLEQKSVSPAAFYGNIVFDEDKMRKIVDKKVSEITLEYEQVIIDKINSLQTYKLAEGDTNILVSRDDVIKILKGE